VTLANLAENTIALITPKIATSSQKMILKLAENRKEVRYEILCADARSFYTTSENGGSCYENPPIELIMNLRGIPCCPDNREANIKSYAQ
jgi:hypothetical protein